MPKKTSIRRPGETRTPRPRVRARREPKEVEASEARLVLALRARRLGVFEWDVAAGTVTFGIPAGFEQFSRPGPAVVPSLPHYATTSAAEWAASTHPEDAAIWENVVAAVVNGGSNEFRTVYRRRRAPGAEWRWVEARGMSVGRDATGRATRIVGTFENVTSGLQEEQARRQFETSISQATRLTAIAEVASALGHELNQSLAVAMSQIQAASREAVKIAPRAEQMHKALDDALDFVERGAEIVRRYRRLTSTRTTTREAFDLAASARQIVTLLEPDARRAGIALSVVAEAPCVVQGDRIQIEQVLLNLVRNGVDAAGEAPAPPRKVTVTASRREAGASVDVADTGPGVPDGIRGSLFTPFVTTKPNGTGLGLSLSRSIVEAHGGRLRLACGDPGRTIFSMELP